jgi:hypothetical protein
MIVIIFGKYNQKAKNHQFYAVFQAKAKAGTHL